MKLNVQNFAKIKEANIEINGITLIAGENNTGKSTIGKILYCLYSVFKDVDVKAISEQKRAIVRFLINNEYIRDKALSLSDDNIDFVMNIANEIYSNKDHLNDYFNNTDIKYSHENMQEIEKAVNFDNDYLIALIVNRQFVQEFNNQFLPLSLNNQETETVLDLYINGCCNKIIFDKDSNIEVKSQLNLFNDCIYIDDPFSLDRIDLKRHLKSFNFIDFIIGGSTVYKHSESLINKLSQSFENKDKGDLIENALLDERLTKFKNMIKEVVKGDFIEKEKKFVFLDYISNQEIELENLSTGIKSLAVLLKLIENKYIKDKSIIVLDEPEIHLHPKWQLEFAKILILLQQEFNLDVILTSHSPYFISAIQAYSKLYGSSDKCKYYLADIDSENRAYFEDVSNNPGKIFDKLADPFDELDEIIFKDN